METIGRRFDARADEYDSSKMHVVLADAVAGFAAPAGGSGVLDVGTGTGLVLRALAEQYPSAGLVMRGIDISARMIEVARRALPEAVFRVGDATTLLFADDSFDLVTCVTALHLMPDAGGVVAECARVLRPAGRLVTATFMASDAAEHGGTNPDRQRFDTLDKLAAVFAPVGLHPRRHTVFRHGADAVLIAEWRTADPRNVVDGTSNSSTTGCPTSSSSARSGGG